VKATAYTDGATYGSNPAPGGIGVWMMVDDPTDVLQGRHLYEVALPIGEATNNVAEYRAVIEALEMALAFGVSDLTVYTDSMLVVEQVLGTWQTKAKHLRPFQQHARELLTGFEFVSIEYVPREENTLADKLSKQGAAKNGA
jgi:ribonuclease HI